MESSGLLLLLLGCIHVCHKATIVDQSPCLPCCRPEANGIGLANGAAAAPNAIAADGGAADQGPAEPAAPLDELPAAAAAAVGAANGVLGLPENSAAAAGEPGGTQDGAEAGAEAGDAGAHETRLRSNTGRGVSSLVFALRS